MILLIILLTATIALSFLCSLLESTLMSTTLSYITVREQEGYKPATRMKRYKTEPDQALAAILSFNTIANTAGATAIGHQATEVFQSLPIGVVSAAMTILILVCSEIIPKKLGTSYWKHLMGFAASMIRILIFVMYPFVLLFRWIGKLFPESDEATVSRDEVVAMASVGEEEGVIEEDENKFIHNIIHIDDVKASDVMTPRVVAAIASEQMTLREYYDDDQYDHFSRIPVYAESPEYITGYVLRDDALEDLAEDNFTRTLGEIKRPIPIFNEDMSIGEIFDLLLKERSKIAAIIDEYGCFQGILTMEDIIETIFGLEIVDENDEITDMQAYARERWQQRLKRYKKEKK